MGKSRQEEIASIREFFAPRAAGWENRFPDDEPAYAAAVAALGPVPGGTALDAACGTARALPFLRGAVGSAGRVVGVDLTPEMLDEATSRGRSSAGDLVLADVAHLPIRASSVDLVLGAGLLPHLADPLAGLEELARVTRPGGRLGLFHPIGRATLAARHGHTPDPEDIRSEVSIRDLLSRSGWQAELVYDGPSRYLVVAVRQGAVSAGSPL
jgi:SAM-dependent methyltransferase